MLVRVHWFLIFDWWLFLDWKPLPCLNAYTSGWFIWIITGLEMTGHSRSWRAIYVGESSGSWCHRKWKIRQLAVAEVETNFPLTFCAHPCLLSANVQSTPGTNESAIPYFVIKFSSSAFISRPPYPRCNGLVWLALFFSWRRSGWTTFYVFHFCRRHPPRTWSRAWSCSTPSGP